MMLGLMEVLNFINGEFVKINSDEIREKFDPFTGKSIGSVSSSTVIDLVRSIQGAKSAALEIEKIPPEKRAEKLIFWTDIIIRNAALWAEEEARFQGLPQEFVKNEFILNAAHWLKKSIKRDAAPAVFLRPVGVVAISIPWGSNFLLAIERIAPALLAGNAVILHLSENSSLLVKMLAELVQKADWPKGSLQILLSSRAEMVPLLAGHPGINALSYVGHEKHREKIIKTAAPTGKRLQMSLSGKNSLIFLEQPSSPEDLLIKLRPCLLGMGQQAWNAHRIFILESFRDNFLSQLKLALESLQPASDVHSSDLSLWPLVDHQRVEQVKKMVAQIPLEQGKVFWGGQSISENVLSENLRQGHFVQPLFSVDLSNCSPWQQEDLRLPFFIITTVKYSHEIAKWNNTGTYGHSAIIWGPLDKARTLGQKLHVGQVFINKWKINSIHEFVPQKLSRAGIHDYRWNGRFFSEQSLIF